MEGVHVLRSPLRVKIGKKAETFSLNLNIYRNTHHYLLNAAKVAYEEAMRSQVVALPVFDRILIRYFLFPQSKRLCDVSNVCCIVDKFFSDVLVTHHRIPDDNYTVVLGVSYEFGSIDKDNPRVEIHITPI